jgi:CubicO group peptidase (beta-lactamase class C family)
MVDQAVEVTGTVAPGYEGVRSAFEQNFEHGWEAGAALAIEVGGERVVDLVGGHRDAARTRPWTPDTIVSVASTSKGFVAACMQRLVEAGTLDLDAPVAHYWPEFAAHGKDTVTVRHVLTHSAGLPAPSMRLPDEAVYDWDRVTSALADSELWWQPGERHGYHAATYGWINGEVLRRIDGRTLGTYLREEICEPAGIDFHIGVPADVQSRAADVLPPLDAETDSVGGAFEEGSLHWMTFNNPVRKPSEMSSERWRSAEIPSSNGHGSARGVARFYGALATDGSVDGVRILEPASIERASAEQRRGVDAIIGIDVRWGLGYMLANPDIGDVRSLRAFGHAGAGGSLGFADPEYGLGFGYVLNQMGPRLDARAQNLMAAVYEVLR